jgi:hypothetical protein
MGKQIGPSQLGENFLFTASSQMEGQDTLPVTLLNSSNIFRSLVRVREVFISDYERSQVNYFATLKRHDITNVFTVDNFRKIHRYEQFSLETNMSCSRGYGLL